MAIKNHPTAPGSKTNPRPIFGVLAVAPAADKGRVSSVPLGEFGGNINNK